MSNFRGAANITAAFKQAGGLLVVSVNIDPRIRIQVEKRFQIKILDRGLLFYLTGNFESLRKELESILLELSQSGDQDIYNGIFEPEDGYKFSFENATGSNKPKINTGNLLCQDLINLSKGRSTARKFEIKCEEILKYIFQDDFSNWQRQNTTKDTLHQFDLIAKIASTNDFWKILSRDFHSRFVIFEFKNYTNKIKQGQVYSTEKYLYSTALRNIAIILTRKGSDKNAIVAMEGSLREAGKLIISLTQDDLCKMLDMKDKGEDPNTYLTEKIDILLMKLSR